VTSKTFWGLMYTERRSRDRQEEKEEDSKIRTGMCQCLASAEKMLRQ